MNSNTQTILKENALKLINDGFSLTEISEALKLSKTTLDIWFKKWKNIDKPKKETIDLLRNKLKIYAEDYFTTTHEIKELVDIILKLETELIVKPSNGYNVHL